MTLDHLPDITDAVESGRPVHLTDLPDDGGFALWEEQVLVRREPDGSVMFTTIQVCHDGSGSATSPRYEARDLASALDQIAGMLRNGFRAELR